MNAQALRDIVSFELGALAPLPSQGRTAKGPIRCTIWSSRWPGFGLRAYASGKRVWIVQARMDGRVRTVTLGDVRVLSRAQASDVARRVLLRAQVGENPAKVRKSARKAPRYDAFLDEYWEKAVVRWKPSTRECNAIYRKAHIDNAFGTSFIDDISDVQVLRWFTRITTNSGPGAANRCLELMRTMFNRAEAWGLIPEGSNPCNGIKRNKPRKIECWLSDADLARLGIVLEQRMARWPAEIAALRLILLTGCRKGEIVGLRWSEVRGRRLLLHDAKTGPRTVWLGSSAARLLSTLPRYVDLDTVFHKGGEPLKKQRLDTVWYAARKAAGLQHVRLHDLRHSFASHAAMQSETLPMIGKLLGHSRIQSTARYAHLDDKLVVQCAERVGQLIEWSMGAR